MKIFIYLLLLSLVSVAYGNERLIKKMQNPSAEARAAAAQQAGQLKANKATIKALIVLLNDRHAFVQDAAILSLGRQGPKAKKAVKKIEKLARKSKQHWVRGNAVWALGQLRQKRSIKTLTRALKDKHYIVRQAAANALGKYGPKAKRKASKALVRSLKDKNSWVQRNAIMSLQQMKAKKAAKYIKRLQKDKEVGSYAKSAVRSLKAGKKKKKKRRSKKRKRRRRR